MSLLPTIDTPIYTVKLPISEKTVRYRPYNVREQKILAMAKESNDVNILVEAIKQIISNCVLDNVDTTDFSLCDDEFLFYQLRARSESEIVELRYRCENITEEGKTCNFIMNYDLNLLTELQIDKPDIASTIEVTDKIGVKLKYPKLEKISIVNRVATAEETLEIMAKNVEFIYDENSAYNAKDIPIQTVVDWLGDLPVEHYNKIETFITTPPKIIKKLDITCNKCGFDHHIQVEDVFDFFI